MIYLFDKRLALLDIIRDPTSAVMTRRLNAPERLLVETGADIFAVVEECSYLGHFFQERFYVYTLKKPKLTNHRLSLEGVSYAYDYLAGCRVIEDKRPQNVSAQVALEVALEGTGVSLGHVETTSIQSTNFYYVTPLQALQKVVEIWQVELDLYFQFDGHTLTGMKIDLYQKRGRLTGERYTWGSDILEIVQEEDREGIVTALYGRGKGEEILDADGNPTGAYGRRIDFTDIVWSKAAGDPVDKPAGQSYLEIPEMTARYGYPGPGGTLTPRYEVLILDQITGPGELIDATWRALVEMRPRVTFSSTVAKAGPYDLGDTNYIFRPDLGLSYEARIFEDDVNLVNPVLTRFKFGDYIPLAQAKRAKELKKQFEGLNETIRGVEEAAKGQIIKVSKDWYDALEESKADTFFDGASYDYSLKADNPFNLPAGIYSFNAPLDDDPETPLPTGAVVIRNGKIGRATLLPDGSWDFDLIGDEDGLTADAITAGKIKAQFLEIGQESTFLEGYDPSTKAEADQVYTKTQVDTKFTVQDGQITSKVSTEVSTQIAAVGIYKVDLISTGGLIFKNGIVSTTIMARVYKNNIDVTDQIDVSRFRWTKTNADGTPDTLWNDLHIGGAKQVTLTSSDVYRRTSLTCEILEE